MKRILVLCVLVSIIATNSILGYINPADSPNPPNWTPATGVQYTQTIHARVQLLDLSFVSTAGSMLGVFKDDQCMGVANVYTGPAGSQFNLSMGAFNNPETGFVYKVYDAGTDQIHDLSESYDLENNRVVGLIFKPVVFTTVAPVDCTLSDLQVDGTTVTGFDPATLIYNIELPYGTTIVPTVTATPNDIGASHVVNPAASLPGATSVVVTGDDGTTTKTYTVNFTVAPNNDATLSDLKIDGTTVTGFDPAVLVYNIELAYGTTAVPTVTATPNDGNASHAVNPAASVPGTTTVVVTAEDGTTEKTYTVNFTVAPNNDATLNDLKIDGTTVTGFDPAILIYNVVLAYGTTTVPTVTATPNDENASHVVNPAASLPGTTTVVVTAEDGTTEKTYTVNFTIAPNENATLSDLKIDGTTVANFDPSVLVYNIELAYGTTTVPTVTATPTDTNASHVVNPAASLPGSTTVVVTAEDGTTKKTYTVNFTIAPNDDATLNDLKVDGTTVANFDPAVLIYNVELPYGTTTVPTVTATPTDANASHVVNPAASLPGSSTVVVTAEDGTTKKTYTINFTIALNNDATLSDLKSDGTTIADFDPAVLVYNVNLPFGTTTVPTVTATPNDVNASHVVNPAAGLPGATTVVVTAEDGTTKKTYTVNFVVALNDDATLSDLMVDGTTVANFDPAVLLYNVVLPYGTTIVPTVTATTRDQNASHVVNPATSLPGATTVVVTAEDGTTEKTYTVNFTVALNPDATLSDLKVDGVTIPNFDSATLEYNVLLALGTTVVPTVTATTNDPNAAKTITDAAGIPGTTTIEVVAEDGTNTLVYNVIFGLPQNYPNWSNPTGLPYTMTVHAKVQVVGGGMVESVPSLLGAFVDGVCKGFTQIFQGPAGMQFQLAIGGSENGELISFKVYVASLDEVLPIAETTVFVIDGTEGGIGNPLLFHAGQVFLDIPVNKGWNWLSFNTLPEDNSVRNVLQFYNANDNEEIKTSVDKGGTASYFSGQWWGLSGGIQSGTMYLFLTQNTGNFNLHIEGYPVDVSQAIQIVTDWNWIGYNPQVAMNINTALGSLSSEDNDEIKTSVDKGGTASHFSGEWWGFDNVGKNLYPGIGYLLKSSKQDQLIYPGGTPIPIIEDDDVISEKTTNSWENPPGKKYTMTVHARIILPDGKIISANGSQLAAFKDNQCRGVFEIFDGPAGKQFQLAVGSNLESEEGMTYQVYDASNNTTYEISEKLDFIFNETLGKINDPINLSVSGTLNIDNIKNNIHELNLYAYPNPFNEYIYIGFSLNKSDNISIKIYNSLGKLVSILSDSFMPEGNYNIEWKANGNNSTKVPDGIYICKLVSSGGTSFIKLIKNN